MDERRVEDSYGTGVVASVGMREYRKGNWTVSETMVLIEAKKMDDERRTVKRSPGMGGGGGGGGKASMEPRWKWIEDYCWRKGCYRSQNQCNDKWDNLMRDYKKVRDYELRRTGNGGGGGGGVESGVSSSSSYWKMEKTERKERNLPANMILQIYEALVDVVERKGGGVATTSQLLLPAVPADSISIQPVTLLSPPPHQQKSYLPSPALVMVSDQPALTLPSGLPPTFVQQEGVELQRQQAFAASHPLQSTRGHTLNLPPYGTKKPILLTPNYLISCDPGRIRRYKPRTLRLPSKEEEEGSCRRRWRNQ
ncbi:hypothetical protein MLD38_010848 [Melastoma candidum]|uniref:Uncharacterized protein n=1 Tax=Melastoma candidum TaxID=119954 RepID=A0ACB9R163_9MYRT|nr:hypothetical protein MLD38_010848 [Melastoma candidum]